MLTNADITLYNHKYNDATRMDDWHRTVIRGVYFYVDNKAAVSEKGLNSADVYKIRIPVDCKCAASYLPEDEYASASDVSSFWTLQEDDYIVRGICELEIEKPSDLKRERMRYCKITSWADNRFGGLPHWRVGGE